MSNQDWNRMVRLSQEEIQRMIDQANEARKSLPSPEEIQRMIEEAKRRRDN